MNITTHTLIQKLWNYCSVLRDDGMSYGDFVEQLTYLLFLKMADERSQPPYNQICIVPAAYACGPLCCACPPPVIAQEIVEDLQAALEQFKLIAGDLNSTPFEAEIIQH